MPPRTYEVTFTGQADRTLCTQFDDCEVSLGPDTTTLRADLADHAAFSGLMQRMAGLGLEIIHLRLVTPVPSAAASGSGSGQDIQGQ